MAISDVQAPRRSGLPGFVSAWWAGLDRVTLSTLSVLLLLGLVLQLAASPGATARIGIAEPFHFFERQMVFAPLVLIVALALSMLSTVGVRRLGMALAAAGLVAMAMLPLVGHTENGATRWMIVAGQSIQPSEFLKPGFVIVAAWLLTRDVTVRPGGRLKAIGLYAVIALLLYGQPDIGQMLLLGTALMVVLFVAGLGWVWVVAVALALPALGLFLYSTMPHVARRMDAFLGLATPLEQVEVARDAIQRGGLIGVGPGDGMLKRDLPDAHTDYIYAVAGEEFGLLAGLIIIGCFALLAVRSLGRIARADDRFTVCAASGLVALLTVQALVNIGVGSTLLPSKGMTLPFISAGGSSMLGTAITVGFLLALTRERADAQLAGFRQGH